MVHEGQRVETEIGDIVLEFKHPVLESAGSGSKARHEVLPRDPDQNEPTTVIEPLGRENFDWTLRGDCYGYEATLLDNLAGETVELIHERHSGDVYVDDVSTKPQSVEDETGRRYTYTLELIEVR